ncbi:uncharacterized protein LOC133188617 isoform X1 [Saccostrea echinata]|uniref:uncharacterized protein LOC133188617 isoform X1 n=1 Tax=Saccostrea echinata TaxID=191078 RepID=UPI002A83C440|nr:uncharacterized protein LOC133188617 isoform X1 [Saccostrea echinata]
MVRVKFVLLVLILDFTEASNPDGTCDSDSDCTDPNYKCCTGTVWCCPPGYMCTGGSSCLSIGLIIGPIVVVIAIIACVVVAIFCYRKRQHTAGVVYNPHGVTPKF